MDNFQPCPCGTNKAFEHCCKSYIKGETNAPDPEALMRSRYSAYATKSFAYVALSYAANHTADNSKSTAAKMNAPVKTKKQMPISVSDIQSSSENTLWCKLEVLSAFELDDMGEVEFIAYYKIDSEFFAMHELSRFSKIDGKWFYEDGDMLHKSGALKLGRNDHCLCGSGKKFKRCCQG
ncbi:MAG: SEC-C motif-containing protein [Alphaproteobacteria bacterium]|jgi:SEC-C motif-containing protein